MDDVELALRQRVSQRAAYRLLTGSEGSRVVQLPGVQANVMPVAPDRSVPNSVLYEEPEALFAVLDELAEIYADAGVRAWTVWTPPGHEDVGRRLEAAGHEYDGEPPMMAAELADLDLASRRDLDLDPEPDWGTIGRLNDLAYSLPGDLERVLTGTEGPGLSLWVARDGGRPVAGMVVLAHEGDAYVGFVAVAPGSRGRGLSSELLRRALAVASEEGCTTTTLEASPMGFPIYERMGYRNLGRMGMWERRVRNESA